MTTTSLPVSSSLALLCLLGACGPVPAADVGAQLFADPGLSDSDVNAVSCAHCHAALADDVRDDAILPGHPLEDAVYRPAFWGGHVRSLLDATNLCMTRFMRGSPLTADEPKSRALYEYLLGLSDGAHDDLAPLPVTIVENVTSVGRGRKSRGEQVWNAACQSCHGAPHSGDGRISELASPVPESSIEFAEQIGFSADLVVIEKVRHGPYFGVGGTMPPFSTEALSDEDLGALLAFLGL